MGARVEKIKLSFDTLLNAALYEMIHMPLSDDEQKNT